MRDVSGPQFGEAGGGEVTVEGERVLDALGAHVGEAGGVDERVLALVVLAQPLERLGFNLAVDWCDSHMAILASDAVEEFDGLPVPELATEGGPGLAAHMSGRNDRPFGDLPEELQRSVVVSVAFVAARDEERSVGEDQGGSGFDGP